MNDKYVKQQNLETIVKDRMMDLEKVSERFYAGKVGYFKVVEQKQLWFEAYTQLKQKNLAS